MYMLQYENNYVTFINLSTTTPKNPCMYNSEKLNTLILKMSNPIHRFTDKIILLVSRKNEIRYVNC